MRAGHHLLLCILGAALLSSVICINGIGPDSCCFETFSRPLGKKLIRSYVMTDKRCPKTGVILITRRSRRICVDPSARWVEGIMRSVDKNNL